MSEKDTLEIFGIPVDKVDRETALSRFAAFMEEPSLSVIVTPNSEIIDAARNNAELKKTICSADMVIPDGIGLIHASKMMGQPFKERVTGIDFTYQALGYCAKHGKKVFLFGGKPGIADKAAEKLASEIPGLIICGCRNGYFKPEEEEEIVKEINAAGTDFLCVALGSPKQELFMQKYRASLTARVAVGIGGSLDVWSGTLNRAPQFFIDHGLEWLYRLKQEPSRFGRMAKIPVFLMRVAITKGKENNDGK